MKFEFPEGATPLDPDSARGLIPALTTQAELNEFEQRNILEAQIWSRRSRRLKGALLTIPVLKELHLRMFNRTWEWAGHFRRTDTNLGVPWPQIPEAVKNLCEDVSYQIAHASYPWDELAVRFHYRLVSIHPFPNGNGRHSRLATEVLLRTHAQKVFSWGSESLVKKGAARTEYIAALQQADGGEIGRLLRFSRS